MAVYQIDFAASLLHAAESLNDNDLEPSTANRAILYLSLLAIEITLKALLERAGTPTSVIKSRSHSIESLMADMGRCEICKDICNGHLHWCRATEFRGIEITEGSATATIGNLFRDDDQIPKSKYPNEIRYGENLIHYRPDTMLNAAKALLVWARKYYDHIRIASMS
jgi:hypothetical protein